MKQHLTVGGYLVHDGRVLLIHHAKLDKWLPVGGHVEEGELLDEAIKREFQEEVNIAIELPQLEPVNYLGAKQLATPFHSNIHNVGDHDHSCIYYLCTSKNPEVKINNELKGAKWFSQEDLLKESIPSDVRAEALKALELARKFF
ncbi:MAG TPA: NUDIX domain-containing protein [Candidatus Norongarragalinales archaeon]|jgi:ADP-ribose pyrophosphatase YjhB (NUDIX family)|nr:NUDIX domain-containing protein [Candidatus Norongarragalinales archaeon]